VPRRTRPARATVAALTALTLIAFAANSVICRLALGEGSIGASAFTALRVVAGAAALLALLAVRAARRRPHRERPAGSWISAGWLVAYAASFSAAYLDLAVGTGALILFGTVQITMITGGLRAGERPLPSQWAGLAAALVGLVYLVLPGLAAPSPVGALLMATAGVSWGLYSFRRGSGDPVATTAGNFARAVPLALIVGVAGLAGFGESWPTRTGVLLAVLSGAVTSGIGYVLWYTVLRWLTATQAAVAQLAAPALAALGGGAFLGETVSARLVVAAAVTLGGVAVAMLGRQSASGETMRR